MCATVCLCIGCSKMPDWPPNSILSMKLRIKQPVKSWKQTNTFDKIVTRSVSLYLALRRPCSSTNYMYGPSGCPIPVYFYVLQRISIVFRFIHTLSLLHTQQRATFDHWYLLQIIFSVITNSWKCACSPHRTLWSVRLFGNSQGHGSVVCLTTPECFC